MAPEPADIVKVRISATTASHLAALIAGLDGWTVLSQVTHPNRREPGERVYMTLRHGYPPVARLHAWLRANGWVKQPDGKSGAWWDKGAERVGVPLDGADEKFTKGAIKRIAAAEGRPLHELLTAVETYREPESVIDLGYLSLPAGIQAAAEEGLSDG